MEEFRTCSNDFIPLLAQSIGCTSMVETKPRVFIGDRSEILDYCKKNNLTPGEYLVSEMHGESKTGLIEVTIVPSKKDFSELYPKRELKFITDESITQNDYVYVCMVSEKIEF